MITIRGWLRPHKTTTTANVQSPRHGAPLPPLPSVVTPPNITPPITAASIPLAAAPAPINWLNVQTVRLPGRLAPTPWRPQGWKGVLLGNPARGWVFHALPRLATAGFLSYLIFRVWTVITVPLISLPIALVLFAAELHCIINGLQFQSDLSNEKKYDQWKSKNWPTEDEINFALSPKGPRAVMQIASAGEAPETAWPTIYGVLEMPGNKLPVWNTQANVGELDEVTANSLINQGHLTRAEVEFIPKKDSKKQPVIDKTTGQPVMLARIFPFKRGLVREINREYREVWGTITDRVASETNRTGLTPAEQVALQTDSRDWRVPAAEKAERLSALEIWYGLTTDGKKNVLSDLYKLFGRRNLTRAGIWVWWGSKSATMPNDIEFERLLGLVFCENGPLRLLSEVKEVGLGDEVDIAEYAPSGSAISYGDDLATLTQKVKAYVSRPLVSPRERLLYGFEYMRQIMQAYKDVQLDAIKRGEAQSLEYFPRNIRSAGEEIRLGLEYEAKAGECLAWGDPELDTVFEEIINTYANAQVIWWDRDRLADQDHSGRKSNSINAFLLHLGGRWQRIVGLTVKKSKIPAGEFDKVKHLFDDPNLDSLKFKPGIDKKDIKGIVTTDDVKAVLQQVLGQIKDPSGRQSAGYMVASDIQSALMRTMIEEFENGHAIWEALSTLPGFMALTMNMSPAQIAADLNAELNAIKNEIEPRRWVLPDRFLGLLNNNYSPANLQSVLVNEGLLPPTPTISKTLNRQIKRTATWLGREKSVEGKRRVINFFINQARKELTIGATPTTIKRVVDNALKDTEIPPDHMVTETYDFTGIEYYSNIDAEVRPRPEYMARTAPLLDILYKQGEIK